MASVVTTVTIGDYRYTLYDDQTARARVTDTSKASYGALQESVTHGGVTYTLTNVQNCFTSCTSLTTAPEIPSSVTYMDNCFAYCTSLTTAPSIPSSVTNINNCFSKCTSLTTAPSIPSSVTSMSNCFWNCAALTTAPSIPSSVTSMKYCFGGCTALTGTIAVHGTPTYYDGCFRNTTQPIVLVVFDTTETPTWTRIASTGNNGNVTVRDVSANPAPTATITAVRVASSASTTPDETGQYAYVTVRTTVSTEQAPDNVAQAPTITLDGRDYTPSDPRGTATFTCHVSLGNDLGHVIGATPRDTYKTGTEVTVTLASTYSPMEFHATPVYDAHGTLTGYVGGDGASFGKHATSAGVLDVAWDIESEGDVSAVGDISGANVTTTGDVSADGAMSCADGSPYCSDGTNVNVGGVTVGSADNLSYVALTDTFRAPALATGYTGVTGVSVHVNSRVYRSGRFVFVSLIFEVTSSAPSAADSIWVTGLPRASGSNYLIGADRQYHAVRMVVTGSGNLMIDMPKPANAWYTINGFYLAAD